MEDILKQLLEVLLPIIGAVLTALSSYAVALITKRMGIKLDNEVALFHVGAFGNDEYDARITVDLIADDDFIDSLQVSSFDNRHEKITTFGFMIDRSIIGGATAQEHHAE